MHVSLTETLDLQIKCKAMHQNGVELDSMCTSHIYQRQTHLNSSTVKMLSNYCDNYELWYLFLTYSIKLKYNLEWCTTQAHSPYLCLFD